MTPSPRPHPRVHDLRRVAEVRHVTCARYSDCLDVAVRERWPGFACGEGCYVEPDVEQRIRDVAGLLAVARWLEDGVVPGRRRLLVG